MTLAGFRSISKILILMILVLALPPLSTSQRLPQAHPEHNIPHTTVRPCQDNPPQPVSSPFLYIWNFTLNLTGRDPGSTTVKFTILDPTNLVASLSDANLTALPSTRPPTCQTSCPQLVTGIIELSSDASAATPIPTGSLATLSFRPATSGTYHLIFYADSTIVYIN